MSVELNVFINKVKNLPVLPSVVLQLNRTLANNSATIDSVSEIIGRDPSLSAKVLQLSNSSYYGLSYTVDSVKRAITVLGFSAVRNLALTVSVANIFNSSTGSIDLKGLWFHSLGSAVAAKSLLYKKSPLLQEKVFLCGIIHDIGKIIVSEYIPKKMEEILRKLRQNKLITESDVEKEIIGFTHSELGDFMARKWHFPQEFSDAINLHHNSSGFSSMKPENKSICAGIFAGNQIAKAMALGKSTDPFVDTIDTSIFNILDITEKELPSVIIKIKNDFKEILNSWKL